MAATPQNVEMEAAKFLHKLIQESTDEPTKLATKLHVILQHMRSSGKENSMPYQVISRAMETVINRHGLDIEALMSSRQPLTSGSQPGDSSLSQIAGPSQQIAVENDSKKPLTTEDTAKIAAFSSKPLHGPSSAGHDIYQGSANQLNSIKNHVSNAGFTGSYESAEPGNPRPMQFSNSYDNQNAAMLMNKGPAGKLDHDGGFPNVMANASKALQVGNVGEMGMLRNEGSRDTGKSPALQAPSFGPFKEHHLKQLRAQCLVFLAFRNNLMPKKLHLEIALGNVFPKEDISSKEHIDQKGKEQSMGPGSSSSGFLSETNLLKEGEKLVIEKNDQPSGVPEHSMIPRKFETDVQSFEAKESLMSATKQPDPPNISGLFAIPDNQGNRHVPSVTQRENWKSHSGMEGERQMVGPKNANILEKDIVIAGTNHESEDTSELSISPATPKFTTSEKWIADCQKRKVAADLNWAVKKKKTEQKISACVEKLKETVSSSEDISAKTKSVIELKKLELLNLQRRLRNEILSDFFRPTSNEMDRLKSIKKHRIGRRSKQLERHEQKMKEERQKRIRERQKDFFGEMEQHRERLEDVFKFRRERLKGFNKYAREFHKRKERLYREKIDRIQREKINLLKINDVEGYLRMVQDAKSDRVKQLLKETEKYLQKLGSKLKEAKVISRCFESDMTGVNDSSEFTIESEDETDQAKHYMESNEKYYLMAHSIKETVAEQPATLIGGKLREYQMNGLRWLLSLYNNHLNGILADEMGLGKTVQVISLLCYLMEHKNDRGPFLVVVPSSVLPGWESEISFWAPSITKIVYSGPPEERRKLFRETIVQQKFNVLLTTYEYLMNKHDRPKLSKIHWHYVIIDEGHRIKNASCKLNAELKHYHSSHRLLLTGTPLQNNLEELWALLNFLLPNIFNSSEDFSQWFNKPFESNSDNSLEEALLSEEENLLIINRLHQVLRPFVLRRLKHKVENELPEKIERLVRCEASAYQKLLMRRVEDNLGAFGATKARAVHNTVVELRNICNHPYISQLHTEEVHDFIPKHYLPNIIRFCGKLEMLDRLLPKLKATDHRILLFSTMTRLLDVMEDYLYLKQYRYLRLDGHTSGGDRGALIDQFNAPGSPFFIFLLSIRAGGVGVNLQAADTVIIFDTDWNPQVDLQAQARAHRIGQKKDVLVLRLETVKSVEEQVRASAEHKLGVANQSITAGFFDNNTSAEDRREYLEALLRECKKEEAAPVLNDDALNDLMARSESEIDVFEEIDKKRNEEELAVWKKVVSEQGGTSGELIIPPLPSRLVTEDELNSFCEAMKAIEVPRPVVVPGIGGKRKGELGNLDMQHYGRGKRAREVRSYEEQWTEDEFEKLCQAENPNSPNHKEELKERDLPIVTTTSESGMVIGPEITGLPNIQPIQPTDNLAVQQTKEVNANANANSNSNPPSKRGRGRPKKKPTEISPSPIGLPVSPSPLPVTSTAKTVAPTVNPIQIPPESQSKITSPRSNPSDIVQSTVPLTSTSATNVTLTPPPGFQQPPASHPPGFQPTVTPPPGFQPISSPPGFQQITPPPPGFQPKITSPTPVSGPSSSQSTLTVSAAPQSTVTVPPVPPSESKSTPPTTLSSPIIPVSVPIVSPTSPDSLSAISPTITPIRGRGRGRGRGRPRGRGRGRGEIVESEVDVPQQRRGRKSHNVVLAIPGLRTSSPAGKPETDSLVVPSTNNDSETVNEPLVCSSPAINVVRNTNTNTPALSTADTPVTVSATATPKSDIASPTRPVPATATATATVTPKSDIASPTTPVPATVVDSVVGTTQTPVSVSVGSQSTEVGSMSSQTATPAVTVPIGSLSASPSPSPSNPGIKQGRGRGRKTVQSGSETTRRRQRKKDDIVDSAPEQKSNEPVQKKTRVSSGRKSVATRSMLRNQASVTDDNSSQVSKLAEPLVESFSNVKEKSNILAEVDGSKVDNSISTRGEKVVEPKENSVATESGSKGLGGVEITKPKEELDPKKLSVLEGEKESKSENEPSKEVEKSSHGESSLPQQTEPLKAETEDEKQAAECSASEDADKDNKTEVIIVPEKEIPAEKKSETEATCSNKKVEEISEGKLEHEEKEKVATDSLKEPVDDSNITSSELAITQGERDDLATIKGSNLVEKDAKSTDDETGKNIFEDDKTPDDSSVEQGGKEFKSENEASKEVEKSSHGDVSFPQKAEPLKAETEDEKQAAECSVSEDANNDNKTEVIVPENELPVEKKSETEATCSKKVEEGTLEHEEKEKVATDPVKEDVDDSNLTSSEPAITQVKGEVDDLATTEGSNLVEKDDAKSIFADTGKNLSEVEKTPDVQKVEKKDSDDVACTVMTEAKSSETEKDEETEQEKVGDVNAEKAIDDVDELPLGLGEGEGDGVETNNSESVLEIDVKPAEKVENTPQGENEDEKQELGSSEINKGENDDDGNIDGGTKMEVDDKSPEKMEDSEKMEDDAGSNEKEVTEDDKSNKELLVAQGNEDDGNTLMEIDVKSPEKTLTEDDQSMKEVSAAQEEVEVSATIDNAMLVETVSKEDSDDVQGETVIEAEQRTDVIPLAEGEEKSSETINTESEDNTLAKTSNKVDNPVEDKSEHDGRPPVEIVETTKEVSVTEKDKSAPVPNEKGSPTDADDMTVKECENDVTEALGCENSKDLSEVKVDKVETLEVTVTAKSPSGEEDASNEKMEITEETNAKSPSGEEDASDFKKHKEDEIMEITEADKECGDDGVTEEEKVSAESSTEERKTEPSEAVVDDDSTIAEISMEEGVSKTVQIQVVDAEIAGGSEPSKTGGDDSTVQEQVAASKEQDQEIGADTSVDLSKSANDDSTIKEQNKENAAETLIESGVDDSTNQEKQVAGETLTKPSESVDDDSIIKEKQVVAAVEEIETEPSKTLTDDSTEKEQEIAAETCADVEEVEPSKTFNDEEVAGKKQEPQVSAAETSIKETEPMPTKTEDEAAKEQEAGKDQDLDG